jgi:hypothetical protein
MKCLAIMARFFGSVASIWLLIALSFFPRVLSNSDEPDLEQLAETLEELAEAWSSWCNATTASIYGPAVRKSEPSDAPYPLGLLPSPIL